MLTRDFSWHHEEIKEDALQKGQFSAIKLTSHFVTSQLQIPINRPLVRAPPRLARGP
jgi:hypothetical protein